MEITKLNTTIIRLEPDELDKLLQALEAGGCVNILVEDFVNALYTELDKNE